MPSIDTLIDDIVNGRITHVGTGPARNVAHEEDLSPLHNIKEFFSDAPLTFTEIPGGRRLQLNSTEVAPAARYLFPQDDRSTLGYLDDEHPVLISGGFSGCAYRLFRRNGSVVAAHVYRPGTEPEKYDELLTQYARGAGWEQLQHIRTDGLVGQDGCDQAWVVTELRGGTCRTIVLSVDNRGAIVRRSQVLEPSTVPAARV